MAEHKFFEIIKPGSNYEFVGRSRLMITVAVTAIAVSIAMLFLNAFVIESRGSMLNWGVDFRGGTELQVDFSRTVEIGAVRKALEDAGYRGVDVVRFGSATADGSTSSFMVRMAAVSVLSEDDAEKARTALAKVKEASLRAFDWSEGGDKIYLRFDQTLEAAVVADALKNAGVETTQVQVFGRAEDNTFEAVLVSLDAEVKAVLEKALGEGVVDKIPQVSSVGAKAGRQLQIGGVKAVLGAIVLIVLYVALRFDFRYGPGTVIALLHDAIVTVGAFAVTYREFSLTTLAAVLTIIGFSVNDTIVIFDRIRENAARYRDRKFDRVVNQSINETLSRTIWTSGTLLFVTLAMNIMGVGVIKDFAFAMNVGIVVGTFSSIYVASPVLLWLHNRAQNQSKAVRGSDREARRARRRDAEAV